MTSLVTSFYLLLTALLLDRLLGEPRRWHPLAGFGRIVHKLEWLGLGPSGHTTLSVRHQRLRGTLAAAVAITFPVALLVAVLQFLETLSLAHMALQTLVLYFCIGWRSLEQHALVVWQSLNDAPLKTAREKVAMIVSRDTGSMNETQVAQAATESVLENGSDALFAPLFWFLIGGAPAVLAYRLANTMDAMWGYRSERFQHFGGFAARLDDLLNYVPARLCALSYSLAGNTRRAWHCWRTQARLCSSPNAGPVMTAGAGALQVQLGGPAIYHGRLTAKPVFGEGLAATADDILRACRLINRSLLVWLVFIGAVLAVVTYGPWSSYGS